MSSFVFVAPIAPAADSDSVRFSRELLEIAVRVSEKRRVENWGKTGKIGAFLRGDVEMGI